MIRPQISVIMASYNHEAFVQQAIESVLSQENVTLEFLIADDGSSDNTANVINAIDDSRLRFFPYKINRGACAVLNELINKSSGEYIAIINSDDIWSSNSKLAYQLGVLESNPKLGACFGLAKFIGENGKPLLKAKLGLNNLFDKNNKTQGEWLRKFFFDGNCLCHPSVLIRKTCYEDIGLYDNRYRQLPDFELWIRLVKKYDIFISDKILVNFRILAGENASSQTSVNSVRTFNEYSLILRNFLDNIEDDLFFKAFSKFTINNSQLSREVIDIEKALLFFTVENQFAKAYKLNGLLKVFELLGHKETSKILKGKYLIDDLWLQNHLGTTQIISINIKDKFIGKIKLLIRLFKRS